MTSFRADVQTHISLLNQISYSVKDKFSEIRMDSKRYKRGILNGAGSLFKAITGNLDAADGEYFTKSINRLNQGQIQVENLLKDQITVTSTVIKNFNQTMQKLRIEEKTFNDDIEKIGRTIRQVHDKLSYLETKLTFIEICEKLMENFILLEDTLSDILNSITFARLKIIHTSIITPENLIAGLQEISQNLVKNNLPLPVRHSSVAQYLEIIELQAFQTQSDLVFVLKIPLVEQQIYTAFHLYPIPIYDDRTGLHHLLSFTQRYIAKNDDSLMYIPISDLSACKPLAVRHKLCSELYAYPIDTNAVCEAQLLKNFNSVPNNCRSSIIFSEGYNVKKLEPNTWLVIIAEPLRVTVNCAKMDTKTITITKNSVLRLQNECSAFIGITKVQAESKKTFNFTDNSHPVTIPYNCCNSIKTKISIPELKPLKLENLNFEELDIANHKLDQYSRDLDILINQPFVTRNISWFTYAIIGTIIIVMVLFTIKIVWKRSNQSPKHVSPEEPPTPENIPNLFSRLLPKLRPVLKTDPSDMELQEQ